MNSKRGKIKPFDKIMLNENLDNALECCFVNLFSQNNIPPKNKKTKKPSINSILNSYKKENYIHSLPYFIAWEITSNCNLQCKHCFYYNGENVLNSKTDLSTDELMELAKFFIEELNIIEFTITGGEPFLRKDIFILLEYLKSKNVRITLNTNATLITEKIAQKLSRILNTKEDKIQISFEGADPKTHETIRGEGTFKKTINGIKHLVKYNIDVKISCTLTTVNLDELTKIYELCQKLKVKIIAIGKFQVTSDEQIYLVPQIDKTFIAIANLINKGKNSKTIKLELSLLDIYDFLNFDKGKELLDDYISKNKAPECSDLMCHNHGNISVKWDGKVYLCPATENDELCLGDLRKQSFFEIWENRFNNVFFQGKTLNNSVCKKCKYVLLCKGGCPAKAYFGYGDINAPHPDCPYGKILMEEYKKDKQSEASHAK